jgi:hypothetical protein
MIDSYKNTPQVKIAWGAVRKMMKILAAPFSFFGQGLRVTTPIIEKTGLPDR